MNHYATKFLPLFLIIGIFLPLTSCGKDSEDGNVVHVNQDDMAMNAAIQKAKETFPKFIENYKTLKCEGYNVKIGVPTSNGGIEHIWFDPLEITDKNIKAKCANEPENVPNLKINDVKTFSRDDISDWMIVVGDKCYGGYTIRVLIKQDPSVPIKFDFKDFN